MRLGFCLGFLIGAALAAVLGNQQMAEAPGLSEPETRTPLPGRPSPQGLVDELRLKAREAMDAGREAAAEREAELKREFETETGLKEQP